MKPFSLHQAGINGRTLWHGRFAAMASPCEVIVDHPDQKRASRITRIVAAEARRIEQHWSRYRDGNIMHRINNAAGTTVGVDPETANMLDYAQTLWHMSDGRFDITSGVLRRVWRFDGSDNIPLQSQINAILPLVGWQKVIWERPQLTMQPQMQLDFGGIGKEYTVDRALQKVQEDEKHKETPILINFGGDLVCNGPRADGQAWQIGIEKVDADQARKYIAISEGGVATSGDANRYLLKNGRRYSHVLDATTGWPVDDAPRSVTVAQSSCTLAGMLATLAILKGRECDAFLRQQTNHHYIQT